MQAGAQFKAADEVGETMARPRRTWTREDSLVVLASYVERPRGALVPPTVERERVRSLLGVEAAQVSKRYWMFAGLDPANESPGDPAGQREQRLWQRYADDRIALMMDADDAARERGRIPHHVRVRADQS